MRTYARSASGDVAGLDALRVLVVEVTVDDRLLVCTIVFRSAELHVYDVDIGIVVRAAYSVHQSPALL